MRRVAAAAILAAVAGPVSAQEGPRIRGEVRDASTGAAIPHALIRSSRGASARSDVSGAFRLDLPAPNDTLRFRALGYRERVQPVQAGDGPLVVRLEPAPIRVDDIVVTATRRAQPAEEMTVAMVVVDREEIASAGASRVTEVLESQPGLQMTPGVPTGENIMIHGIGDARVLVLVDGEPTAGALIENRDLSRLSTLAVERVEVVKGPMSVMYGSDALGGVINVVTTDPDDGFHPALLARMGADGRAELSGSVAGGSDIRFRMAGGLQQQGWTAGVAAGEDRTLARLWDLKTTVRAVLTPGATLRGDLSFVRERQRWPVSSSFNGFNDNWGATAWTEVMMDGASGTWTVRALYQVYEHLYREARGEDPIADSHAPEQREELAQARVQWSRPIGAHRLDLGVEGGRRAIRSPEKILGDRASDAQVAGYVQDTWVLGRLVATLGLRLTHNDRWGDAVTPAVGVAWEATDRLRVRSSIGRGFRGPSFKELGWNFANPSAGYTVLGNPNLVPERSRHVSLGLTWRPAWAWRFGLGAFRNDIDDLIETEFVGTTEGGLLIFSPTNVARARTQGIEASAEWSAAAGLELAADYTYLHARDREEDLPLNRRATHSGRVRGTGTWQVGSRPLGLTVAARYTGSAPLVGTAEDGPAVVEGHQGSYWAVDGQVRVGLVDDAIALEVGVDNLLDARPSGWPSAVGRRGYVGVRAGW